MSFLRHEEIYRSDVGTRQDREQLALASLPVLIGFDEFPVGYSLAGCPPAEPASASPTRDHSPQSTAIEPFFRAPVCSEEQGIGMLGGRRSGWGRETKREALQATSVVVSRLSVA